MPVSLGSLEDKRRYCVRECSDHSLGEREVICMPGWQGAPGPAGCQMQKRLSDRMAIGARPTAGAGDGSALLPQAPL